MNKELLNEINNNELIKVNNIYLKRWHLKVLEKYNINTFNSLSNLIFRIEEVLEQVCDEELEQISIELSERNYYENTNK